MENQEELEVEEQSLDKELAGHGIIEHGMSLQDKRELLAVFKASESTALEEENDRVGVQCSRPIVHEIDVKIDDCIQEPEITSGRNVDLPFKDVSLFSSPESPGIVNKVQGDFDSDKLESSQSKISKFSPKISKLSLNAEVKASVNNLSEENSQPDMITSDSKPQQVLLNISEEEEKSDASNADSTLCLKNNQLQLQHKVLSKEDRKRNIDVFNCEGNTDEHPLEFKQQKVNGKPAFYYVPRGMDLKDFTVYFKKKLDTMAQQLVVTQRKSLNFVQWGDPVVVGYIENKDVTVDQVYGQSADDKLLPVSQNQRYNFRGRSSKRKCTEDIFQYSSEEESSDEDQLFRPSKKDTKPSSQSSKNPYFGVTKRKTIFSSFGSHLEENGLLLNSGQILNNENNHPLSDDESSICDQDMEQNSQNRSKLRPLKEPANKNDSVSTNDKLFSYIDDDSDQETNNYGSKLMAPKAKGLASKRKKGKRQLFNKVSPIERIGESSRTPMWLNTLSYEPDEKIVIKPGPVSMRKKTSMKNKLSLDKTQKLQKASSQEADDKVGADESEEIVQTIEDLVACPICKEMFQKKDVEFHAADCNSDDLETSDVKCPICQHHFASGSNFDNHAKQCKVNRRLVPPPLPAVRSRNKR